MVHMSRYQSLQCGHCLARLTVAGTERTGMAWLGTLIGGGESVLRGLGLAGGDLALFGGALG